MTERHDEEDAWVARWLDAATERSMTQRKLASIEAHGGTARLVRAAMRRGIHLVRITDDQRNQLVAASRHPFEVLC